jgi:hypothetical protein
MIGRAREGRRRRLWGGQWQRWFLSFLFAFVVGSWPMGPVCPSPAKMIVSPARLVAHRLRLAARAAAN